MKYMSEAAKQLILKERVGEQRIVKKFLVYPRRFGAKPSRVFEYAYIVEEVQVIGTDWYKNPSNWAWREIDFADDVEEVVITRRASTQLPIDINTI